MAVSGKKALQFELAGRSYWFCCDTILKVDKLLDTEVALRHVDAMQNLLHRIFPEIAASYRIPKVVSAGERRYRDRRTDPLNCIADAFFTLVGIESGVIYSNPAFRGKVYYAMSPILMTRIEPDKRGTAEIVPVAGEFVYALLRLAGGVLFDAGAFQSLVSVSDEARKQILGMIKDYGLDENSDFTNFMLGLFQSVRSRFY